MGSGSGYVKVDDTLAGERLSQYQMDDGLSKQSRRDEQPMRQHRLRQTGTEERRREG